MIENIEKKIVLVASQNEVGNNYIIHGTGFLISRKDKAYVVTCRHVARKLENSVAKFVITNPKRTTNISVRFISEPIYYNLNEPYVDLCLMELPEYPASVLNANGISTINLDSLDGVFNAITEDKLIAYGYPGDFVLKYLMEDNPNISVPIHTISCTVTNWLLEQDSYHPINTEDLDLYDNKSAQLTYTKSDILYIEGMSGGPVLKQETGCLCGVVTGGQTTTLPTNKVINIFIITPVSYLIEQLNRLL